ncbi:MAG: protein kinase [Paracoccaceae bacterium]|nr:protein kinase [Paracoccaceae bacterium]
MNATPKIYGDRWIVVRPLSKGGQGQVFLVRDQTPEPNFNSLFAKYKELQSIYSTPIQSYPVGKPKESFTEFVTTLRTFLEREQEFVGALKLLLPSEEGVATDKEIAARRMEQEISVLQSVEHPSLVKILDSCAPEQWFVMDYMDGGNLSVRLDVSAGRPLDALKALRPVVEAVSRLHDRGFVHRDIKPGNIFVAKDGRLVLGDCGLAFRLGDVSRNTATFENVGTRDFQPPWSQGQRVEDVRPTFDVWSLGKTLWSMVSGRPVLQLWYFDRKENDLRNMFPGDHGMQYIHYILEKCIVENEVDLKVRDASELLKLIDEAIWALENGCQLPSKSSSMRCRFCGIGKYEFQHQYDVFGNSNTAYEKYVLVCLECGHVDVFAWPRADGTGESMPPNWRP